MLQRLFLGCRIGGEPGWIVKSVLNNADRARKYGTGLVRMTANGDHVIERGVVKIVDRFAPMAGNIDADFAHHSDCERIKTVGFNTCTKCFDLLATQVPAEAFRHLTSTGITGAQEQYPWLSIH